MSAKKITISLIHPSRQRPSVAFAAAQDWFKNTTGAKGCEDVVNIKYEYILSVDYSDPTLQEYREMFHWNGLFAADKEAAFRCLMNDNHSAIEAINEAAEICTGDIIVVMSDDFRSFEGWDAYLAANLYNREDYLVKTSDGIQEWLITLPIMDRKYYERFGYIYYPEYRHMFCDTEMTAVGELLGKIIDLKHPDCVFRHLHPCAGLSPRDEVYDKNDATWEQGERLFYARKAVNFNLDI